MYRTWYGPQSLDTICPLLNREIILRVWSKLRHLGLIKTRNADGSLTNTVEELNAFFADTARQQDYADRDQTENYDYLEEMFDDNKLYFKHATPGIIGKTITRIKSNAVGVDGISLKLIRMILSHIMPVLEHIFNFSLTYGIVPKKWKTAIIVPIPKIKNPTTVQHYRPISILPLVSKALERICLVHVNLHTKRSLQRKLA